MFRFFRYLIVNNLLVVNKNLKRRQIVKIKYVFIYVNYWVKDYI